MTQRQNDHYGARAVKRSLLHFVLGKGVAAAAAFAVLVIIIRQLEPREFAVYTSMHAMVLIVGVLSSFGTNAILMRFLPELRSKGNVRAMYRLLFSGVTVRGISYAAVALLMFAFAGPICDAFNMGDSLQVVRWYCLVGFLRINATFVTGALESLLWQRLTQYSTAFVGLCKLALVAFVAWRGGMDLRTLVAIEVVTELALLLLLLVGAVVRWRSDEDRHVGDLDALAENRSRFNRFGFWNYMQNLTALGYGSATNRLFASYFLPGPELVAMYGVIDRFIDYVRRYEPLHIFVGLVRPVINSRFSQQRELAPIVDLANSLFRANLLVLVAPLVIVAVAGDGLFDWITGGRYQAIAMLFLGFYVVAIVASVNSILDILVKLLEESRIYAAGNIALSASIILAIPLMARIGLWGLAIANGIGLLLSFIIIFWYLKARGHAIRPDWGLIARVFVHVGVAIAVGRVLLLLNLPAWLAAVVAEACFLLAVVIWPPLRPDERTLVAGTLARARRRFSRGRSD
jgi:O-antigen/teichoic acid export membrane protein